MQRGLRIAIALVLLVISAGYISQVFSWTEIRESFAPLDWRLFLMGATLLLIVNIVARTLRWWFLLREQNDRVSFQSLYLPTMIFVSLSMMTPGQLGEVMKVEVLKRQFGIERLPVLGAFFVERLLDFGLVVVMSIFGLLTLFSSEQLAPPFAVAVILMATIVTSILAMRYLELPGRLGTFLERIGRTLRSGTGFPFAVFLTIVSWSTVVAAWHLTFKMLDVHLELHQTIAITGLVTLSVIVSFIPGGLGISELVTAELLILCGVDLGPAQASALAIRLLGVWWIIIGLVHLAWWAVRLGQTGRRAT